MNLNQKFSILFRLKHDKINKQGFTPIWVRITIDGQRSEFSTQRKILCKHWDAENTIVKKECPDANSINEFLALMRTDLTRHYNILLTTKDHVFAEDVKNSYKDIQEEKKKFFQLYDLFQQKLTERKEIQDLSEGRHKRFEILRGKCEAFVQYKFKKRNVILEEIKLNFIVEFVHYLRVVQKVGHNTVMKYAKDLKQILRYAVMLEYIPSNPLEHFQCTYKRVKREYLDDVELDTLYHKEFSIKRLEEVRDCYLFSCYTGYGYADAEALTHEDIAIGIDGEKWIIRDRIKTDTTENVRLLSIPLEIIQKYRSHPYCKINNKLLPMNSNQRYNAYLKEIADLCGIKKKLTTHTARHTFVGCSGL